MKRPVLHPSFCQLQRPALDLVTKVSLDLQIQSVTVFARTDLPLI